MGVRFDPDFALNAQNSNIKEVQKYFARHFQGNNYSYLLVGNKNKLDVNALKKLGQFEELSLEDIFNF